MTMMTCMTPGSHGACGSRAPHPRPSHEATFAPAFARVGPRPDLLWVSLSPASAKPWLNAHLEDESERQSEGWGHAERSHSPPDVHLLLAATPIHRHGHGSA
jgi:hypothetical protein